MIFYRARYYNPAIGRFASEDPLRFDAGMNFYPYVGNNPVLYRDPNGLKVVNHSKCPIWIKEEGNGTTHVVMPGGTHSGTQDGYSSPCTHPCKVFKTVKNIDVTVNPDGNGTTSGGNLYEQGGQIIRGGWKDASFCLERHRVLDYGWDLLFDTSGMQDTPNCKCNCPQPPPGK